MGMGSFRRMAMTAAAGMAVLVVGGCGSSGTPDGPGSSGGSTGGSTSSRTAGSDAAGSDAAGGRYVAVDSPVMAFRLHLTADEKLDHSQSHASASGSPSAGATSSDPSTSPDATPTGPSAPPDCDESSPANSPADWANLERNGDYLATFEVDPPRCGTSPPTSGNGRRPLFHSTADLTKDQLSQAHRFSIGSGTVVTFEQPYFECTQSCKHWSEPVALVMPDTPADRAYPTLVIRSDRAALDRADLEDLVKHRLSLPAPRSPSQTPSSS